MYYSIVYYVQVHIFVKANKQQTNIQFTCYKHTNKSKATQTKSNKYPEQGITKGGIMENMTEEQLRLKCLQVLEHSTNDYDVCEAIVAAAMMVEYVKTGMLPVSEYRKFAVDEVIRKVFDELSEERDYSKDSTDAPDDKTCPINHQESILASFFRSFRRKSIVFQGNNTRIGSVPPE